MLSKIECHSQLKSLVSADLSKGHVYIIIFNNNMVKVGKSKKIINRLRTHEMTLGAVAKIKEIWVSIAHDNYSENEKHLITKLSNYNSEIYKCDNPEKFLAFANSLEFENSVISKESDIKAELSLLPLIAPILVNEYILKELNSADRELQTDYFDYSEYKHRTACLSKLAVSLINPEILKFFNFEDLHLILKLKCAGFIFKLILAKIDDVVMKNKLKQVFEEISDELYD
jgi:hypothetical protein